MDITIQHLKLVNVVVKEGSITRAADKLHLSQPALSHQLKNLEQSIDLKVFNRINKKLILTEAGDLLFQTSERLLTSISQLQGQLRELNSGDKKTIRLSTECYTTYHWLPDVISDCKANHENVSIEINIEATKAPLHYLKDGLKIGIKMLQRKTKFTSLSRIQGSTEGTGSSTGLLLPPSNDVRFSAMICNSIFLTH